jgi:hypothetical protein
MPWHAYAFIEHVLHVMGLRSLKTFVFSHIKSRASRSCMAQFKGLEFFLQFHIKYRHFNSISCKTLKHQN